MDEISKRFYELPEVNPKNLNDFFIFFDLDEGDIFRISLAIKFMKVFHKARDHGMIILWRSEKSGEYNSGIDYIVNHSSTYRLHTVFVKEIPK